MVSRSADQEMAKCCSLTDGWSEGSNLKRAAAAGQKVRSQVATPAETNDNLSAAAKILSKKAGCHNERHGQCQGS